MQCTLRAPQSPQSVREPGCLLDTLGSSWPLWLCLPVVHVTHCHTDVGN